MKSLPVWSLVIVLSRSMTVNTMMKVEWFKSRVRKEKKVSVRIMESIEYWKELKIGFKNNLWIKYKTKKNVENKEFLSKNLSKRQIYFRHKITWIFLSYFIWMKGRPLQKVWGWWFLRENSNRPKEFKSLVIGVHFRTHHCERHQVV